MKELKVPIKLSRACVVLPVTEKPGSLESEDSRVPYISNLRVLGREASGCWRGGSLEPLPHPGALRMETAGCSLPRPPLHASPAQAVLEGLDSFSIFRPRSVPCPLSCLEGLVFWIPFHWVQCALKAKEKGAKQFLWPWTAVCSSGAPGSPALLMPGSLLVYLPFDFFFFK